MSHKYNWEEISKDFDYLTNRQICDKYNINNYRIVCNYRNNHGYKAVYKRQEIDHLLGIIPDKEIANMIGITPNAVTRYRLRHGIAPCSNKLEHEIINIFTKQLINPKTEVRTPYGIIDILTDDTIYECKPKLNYSTLHMAIGQLLMYSLYGPKHKLTIVANENKLSEIYYKSAISLGFDIIITGYDIHRKGKEE
jgi:hypothetical protein